MKRFKNILLVCHFEAKQHMAVERAVSLARQNEARLTVFSVIRELPAEVHMATTGLLSRELLDLVVNDYREKVDALVADMARQGVDARIQVVTGTPFLEIIRQVLRDRHDLVILAAEGKGGVKERLFGSTSMHLMRKCPCPVWVVKSAKRAKYKRILAAVDITNDFPDRDRESLNPLIMQLASSLVRMDGSEFHLVQVWSVFAEGYLEVRGQMEDTSLSKLRKDTKRQYTRKLDSLLADVDLNGITVHKHLPRSDNASRAIIKLAKSKKIDLLVMGTVCRTGLAGFFIGNTAEKVLSEVNCSVLTVKPEGFITPVTLENS
ncbi:Universal stress protein family 1 [hydrothermal vent metagenome]|uniref:Universal stress protein family 1 n=1 Tax=hydrothermal vent metagenome TaxID=652676 RepID=A0A3B0Y0L2_9ZZZZ